MGILKEYSVLATNIWRISEFKRMVLCNTGKENNLLKLFLNGILMDQIPVSSSIAYTTNHIFGCRHNIAVDHCLSGRLDNFEIWNMALSSNQIQQFMNCPPTGNEPGLVGYWNFEEGTGTTVTDLTTNGNDGNINGATWSTDTPEQICLGCTASNAVNVSILDPTITASAGTICLGDSTELIVEINDPCSAPNGNLSQGLIGWWPFCGNANDEAGNGNNGTVNGATLTTDRFGNPNGAYEFDGVDDYIDLEVISNIEPNSDYSWSFGQIFQIINLVAQVDSMRQGHSLLVELGG